MDVFVIYLFLFRKNRKTRRFRKFGGNNMKTKLSKLSRFLVNPQYRFLVLAERGVYNTLSDEEYIKRCFRARMGYDLDLESPKTFNEKLQWLKLNDRKHHYSLMVDKYEVKKYAADLIGEQYVIPSYGVWNCFDDIDFASLPNEFVLKCTHDSGGLVICRDKSTLDIQKTKYKIEKSLKNNFYLHMREWPYKDVKPRILAEQYICNRDEKNLKVYKVFNFSGVPKLIQVITNDKQPNESIDYFDTEWKRMKLRQNFPNSDELPKKPETLPLILELSAKCSQNFPFLRTDWYEVNGEVKFSEFTFYSDAGFEPFHPNEWDKKMGDWIILPK